jgi:hypothetical protein
MDRVLVNHEYGEVYPNVFSDFDWVRQHRNELLDEFGECVILVYEKQVVGHGQSLQAAIANAEQNLPANVTKITPITEYLRYRHPFVYIRSKATE